MQLLGGIPVLACRHIGQTLAFYQRALRFVILNHRDDEDGLAWVHIQSGEVALMLEKAGATPSHPGASGPLRLYYYVDDVSALHHYLVANRFSPGVLRHTAYGAQEFDITDPEGNRLTLGQSGVAESSKG